jgi:hypothetical protein
MGKTVQKKVTIDGLARMVQNSFTDLKESLVLKEDFLAHERVVLDQFRLLNAEVRDIKTTLGPTVVIVAEQEKRIQTLESRLERVEHRVGIVRVR